MPARSNHKTAVGPTSAVSQRDGLQWLFGDQHFALESIWVTKEDTSHRAEVIAIAVAGTMLNEPLPNCLEALYGCRLQSEVVEPPASPHSCLPVRLLITGRFLAIEPPHLLRFTWSDSSWPDPTAASIVTVAFEPLCNDQTLMTICDQLTEARAPISPW